MMENSSSKGLWLKLLAVFAIELMILTVIMLITMKIISVVTRATVITNDTYLYLFSGISFIAGIIISLISTLILLKYHREKLGIILLCMVLIQVPVFFMLHVSAISYINQTMDLLKSDKYLKEIFYDKYAISAIVFGYSYDEWKEEMIKEVEGFIPTMKEYEKTINVVFATSNVLGTGLGCLLGRKKPSELSSQ